MKRIASLLVVFGLLVLGGFSIVYATTTREDLIDSGNFMYWEHGIMVNPYDNMERPPCDDSVTGMFWYTDSGSLVADKMEICMKTALDTYVWKNILAL